MTQQELPGLSTFFSGPDLLSKQSGKNRRVLGSSLNYLVDLLESNNLPFGDLELFRRQHARYLDLEKSSSIDCLTAVKEWAATRFKPEWLSWNIESNKKELSKLRDTELTPELIASIDDVMLIIRMCRKLEKIEITVSTASNGICFAIAFLGKFRQEELRLIEDAGLNFSLTSCSDSKNIKTRINCELEKTELRATALYKTHSLTPV
ncbi:hypothetical protein MLD52_16955 [Puniceicoccaceae bacterium K14]|nr:hypothetical protein [Puniceicoccaceae bacterium K14]